MDVRAVRDRLSALGKEWVSWGFFMLGGEDWLSGAECGVWKVDVRCL